MYFHGKMSLDQKKLCVFELYNVTALYIYRYMHTNMLYLYIYVSEHRVLLRSLFIRTFSDAIVLDTFSKSKWRLIKY